jgi:hypothetical protein
VGDREGLLSEIAAVRGPGGAGLAGSASDRRGSYVFGLGTSGMTKSTVFAARTR